MICHNQTEFHKVYKDGTGRFEEAIIDMGVSNILKLDVLNANHSRTGAKFQTRLICTDKKSNSSILSNLSISCLCMDKTTLLKMSETKYFEDYFCCQEP
jgi:hypothetical protein